ncbi:MAG: SMI1/KNR4 family protein [Phycisphaerales bacterium]
MSSELGEMCEQDFISRITEVLSRCPRVEHGAGATSREILVAEAQLRVAFPPVLREYLAHFGYLGFGYEQIYGLGAGVPNGLNLVEEAQFILRMEGYGIPSELVPLLMTEDGEIFYIDTKRSSGIDCPVVRDLYTSSGFKTVANTFEDWLSRMIIGSEEG